MELENERVVQAKGWLERLAKSRKTPPKAKLIHY